MTLPGLDAYLTREPDARDEGQDPQRLDEAAREQRWAEFVAWLRYLGRTSNWYVVLARVADAYGGAADAAITGFAETEQWSGVLSAVARAMNEQATEAAEIERRR